MATLREIFDSFDTDHSGSISTTEIVDCLTKLYEGDKAKALSVIDDVFKTELNDARITWDEFKAAMDKTES